MIIKKEVFEKVGPFDEIFFMYGEEIDWCWRANIMGYKFIFSPASIVYHIEIASVQKWPIHKKTFYLNRNHLILLVKNYSFKTLFMILPVKIVMEFISFFYYIVSKKFKSAFFVLKSLKWIIINYSLLIRKNSEVQKKRIISDRNLFKKIYISSIAFQYHILKKKSFLKL